SLALWRMLPALAAKATGRRLIVLPSTFGPFPHRGLTRIIKAIVGTADAVAAREPLSARSISRVVGRDVPALLDPAFFLTGPRMRPERSAGSHVAAVMRLEMTGLRAGTRRSAAVIEKMRDSGYQTTVAMDLLTELARELETEDVLTVLVQANSD